LTLSILDTYTIVNPPQGDAKVNKRILHRYQIAKGHLEKVISMIKNGSYCIDIVHQSLAIQAALKKADDEVLRNHLETCVSEAIKRGDSKKAINEVVGVLRKR